MLCLEGNSRLLGCLFQSDLPGGKPEKSTQKSSCVLVLGLPSGYRKSPWLPGAGLGHAANVPCQLNSSFSFDSGRRGNYCPRQAEAEGRPRQGWVLVSFVFLKFHLTILPTLPANGPLLDDRCQDGLLQAGEDGGGGRVCNLWESKASPGSTLKNVSIPFLPLGALRSHD